MAGVVNEQARRGMSLFEGETVETPDRLPLHLTVTDRDTIDELASYTNLDEREHFALNALRIGVLALRQARGRVDGDVIQRETQRMLAGLQTQLTAHASAVNEKLTSSLKEYFEGARVDSGV